MDPPQSHVAMKAVLAGSDFIPVRSQRERAQRLAMQCGNTGENRFGQEDFASGSGPVAQLFCSEHHMADSVHFALDEYDIT